MQGIQIMSDEVRIIVAGSRGVHDYTLLSSRLSEYLEKASNRDITIISGMARGADQLGERFAKDHGLKIKQFPANWNMYGKSAGPIRNRQMAEYAAGGRGVLFAFWDGLSRGTQSMISLAEQYGLEIHIIHTNQVQR